MIDNQKIPRHIAIIMDGNGRWAKNQGHDRLYGHENGINSVRSTIDRCAHIGVDFLTLYVFSAENWGRPQEEVEGLMSLLCRSIRKEAAELAKNGIKVRAIGDRESMPAAVVEELGWIEEKTAEGKKMTVLLAINYGARNEITRAARMIASEVAQGHYSPEAITCENISEHLYTADYPDPDLVIRTGGECRLSNFLLWQAAYAELYFTDTYWPDFGADELDKAIEEYGRRERRFGKIDVKKKTVERNYMKNHLLSLIILVVCCATQVFAQSPAAGAESDNQRPPMMDYDYPKMYTVKDIRISGLKFLDANTLMAVAGLKVGDQATIPGSYISSAMTKLWNMRNFSDVDITAEIEGDSVVLFVELTERPRVNSWNIEGLRGGQVSEIKEKLKITRGGSELSDYIIDKNIKGIKDYLIEKSFLNANVDVRISNVPNSDGRNIVDVTFLVDRGPRVKIGDVVFEGNEAFTDKRLRRTFKKTNKVSFNIFKSSKFSEEEFANDKENLIDFYNSKGYRNADIISDSVYRISDNRIGVKVNVSEGNQFFIRDVDWVGNSLYSTDYLGKLFDMERGDTYDKKKINKNLGIGAEDNPEDPNTVSSLYQNEGYLFSQINPVETVVGQDSIDITINIIEGQPARWNEVNIVGNYRVNDEVIRRELATLPGDLYNRALIMRTLRLLAGTQHFNPESLSPQLGDVPGRKDLVNLTWNLEEQASDRAEISGGWGAGMFVGSVSLILNNVSIKNFFKKDEWRPYPQGQNQQLAIMAQTNGKYYSAYSLGFTEPWLGGKKPNSLSVSMHYSNETNAISLGRKATKHFRTVGIAAGIGRRLSWPDQNFTLYNELSYQAYMLKDWNYFVISNGTSNVIALNTVFARNTIDNPIFPSSGSEFSISLSLTPPYSLLDGRDYKDENMPEEKRYKWIEYHKWKLKGEWYNTIARGFDRNLVLMAKVEMGYLGHYNKYKQSPFEGFDVGGDGMSGYNIYGVDVIGLRGYENGALTPLSTTGDYAHVYNKVSLELRYPIVMSAQAQAYALAFAEGGNAFSGWNKFDPFKLKRSAGFGIRVVLPIVGMIGVDWAYGFDRAVGASKKSGGQLHYVFGTQF